MDILPSRLFVYWKLVPKGLTVFAIKGPCICLRVTASMDYQSWIGDWFCNGNQMWSIEHVQIEVFQISPWIGLLCLFSCLLFSACINVLAHDGNPAYLPPYVWTIEKILTLLWNLLSFPVFPGHLLACHVLSWTGWHDPESSDFHHYRNLCAQHGK